jgi:uncharacterized protein YrrD
MLRKASELVGASISAQDGEIGSVTDLLFDDENWSVRWLVVDTGPWLTDRNVLLPSSHLIRILPAARGIAVDLTREQVKSSPGVDTNLPVSRQMEASIYDHYGAAPYWPGAEGAPMTGHPGYLPPPGSGYPGYLPATGSASVAPGVSPTEEAVADRLASSGDPHLRSAHVVTGYDVQGSDGAVGHVEDFLIDSEGWAVRYIIVDTKNWWPGGHVLVAPGWVESIDWAGRIVRMSHSRDEIKNAPEYDPTQTIDRDYEARLHRHYGMSEYWQ